MPDTLQQLEQHHECGDVVRESEQQPNELEQQRVFSRLSTSQRYGVQWSIQG
jgi:hypothetical protein